MHCLSHEPFFEIQAELLNRGTSSAAALSGSNYCHQAAATAAELVMALGRATRL